MYRDCWIAALGVTGTDLIGVLDVFSVLFFIELNSFLGDTPLLGNTEVLLVI